MQLITRQSGLRERGFTLIEVMITIFVTAIGLLTVAGLQAAAKKVNYETAQRTAAVALAQDMVERMRGNNPNQWSSYVTSDATTAAVTTTCDASGPCNNSNRAAYDLGQWGAKLKGAEVTDAAGNSVGGLVNPTGCISISSGVVHVAIAWRGTSVSPNSNDTTCGVGSGTGKYSDPTNTSTNDDFRRVISVDFM